jgi:hypothetical protein
MQATSTQCPKCGVDDSIDVGATDRLCLSCRYEWDTTQQRYEAPPTPDEPPARRTGADVVADIMAAESIEAVLTPDLTAAELLREHGIDYPTDDDEPTMVGHFVRDLVEGDILLVVDDDDPNALVCETVTGKRCVLGMDRVADLGTEAPAAINDVPRDTTNGNEPLVGVVFTIASLCLTTGVAAVDDDDERTILNPPTGWLPPPASDIPEAEQGAAYAVAILVRTFNLDTNVVLDIARSLMAGAQASTTESE